MRLNIFTVEYHTRPILSKDGKGNPALGNATRAEKENVAAETREAAAAAISGAFGSKSVAVEIEAIANHHRNVLIAPPTGGAEKPKTKKAVDKEKEQDLATDVVQ